VVPHALHGQVPAQHGLPHTGPVLERGRARDLLSRPGAAEELPAGAAGAGLRGRAQVLPGDDAEEVPAGAELQGADAGVGGPGGESDGEEAEEV